MATTTGIQGGPRQGQNISGLDQLRSLERDKAGELLTRLGDDLNNRTGVVRLLHTSKTDKDMKFKTAGGFKQMFLNGGKLEQSGVVIRDLLAKAGAKQDQLDAFDGYLRTRGHSGVQAQRIREEIDQLKQSMPKAVVAATESEALAAFGMNITTDAQAKVGEGSFGEVFKFEHEGQAMVYKHPKRQDPTWELQLQDPSGRLLKPRRDKPAESNEDLANQLNAALFAGNNAGNSLDSSSTDSQMGYLAGNPGSQGPASPQGVALSRQGLAIAARVKSDIPEAIAPSVYVIKETQPSGAERFHAVGGGQDLKSWARQQPGNSALAVVSMVLPMAAGVQPVEYGKHGATGNIDPSDLKPMARAGLQGLQNFSKHGFIHGDIKPENMIWDTNTQTLRVIDLDGMRKISKKPGSEIPQSTGAYTKAYMHPMKINTKAAVGVGRDLFAFGLTLLETAVLANGSGDNRSFRHLQDYLTNNKRGLMLGAAGRQQFVDRIDSASQGYSVDSVEHFALQAIKTALEYEGNRLQNGLKSYDRWQADDASHPLNMLAQHPAVLEL